MTISSTTVKVSYSGNGSTTVFAYTFKILDDDEIQVIIRSSTGTETVKTKTTHYTVSGVGSAGGGNITFLTAPTSTQTVVLRRLTTQTQETDYIANDPFPADSHEDALDRITMVAQEIQEELGRAIKLSKTNTITSTEFTVDATDRANKILAFDTNGEISVTQELGTYQGNWATATTYYARDIIKDTSNNNIYIANTAHTSTGSQPISTNADVAKWDLLVDAASASTYANAAANSSANSSNFANNSSNSANTSANHSANSSNFANNASNHATNASTYSAGVAANASNASNFANNSSNSANSASNHSSNSSNFANNSSNSANNSSNSSNSSANHSANSSNFANNSSNSANTSANHASNSSNHSANSSNFANNSSNSANTSANHASNSSNHASNSSNHASNSSNHSANSSNFANNSSNHSSNASNAANAANSARDAALVAADNFDDVYLGAKASAPTLDNDGDPLTAGDLYYNTVSSTLQVYSGSAWQAAAVSTAGFVTLTDTQTLTNKTLTLPTIDNIKIGYTTTATAAGTTTLTSASNYKQYFTGSTTQTIVLPVVTTLTLGHTFEIHNNSSGSLTVNSSGSNLVGTVQANTTATCTCILVTGTTAASWDFDVTGFTSALPTTRGGTGLTALGSSLQVLRTNSGATALEFATISSTLTYSSGTATGNGSTTAFTISSGRAVDDVLVFVNGFQLTPTTDYTISSTTLTFVTAPANNAEISYRYLPIPGTYTSASFTGNGSSTTITIDAGRAVNDVLVVVNGLTLVPTDDYTISGTTLTFISAPANLAEITVRYLRLS